ncbi:MAG: response regulator [Gammaproteobacteria bacterium]|nr:response regulator [Gammaproteobacteria bacterium]
MTGLRRRLSMRLLVGVGALLLVLNALLGLGNYRLGAIEIADQRSSARGMQSDALLQALVGDLDVFAALPRVLALPRSSGTLQAQDLVEQLRSVLLSSAAGQVDERGIESAEYIARGDARLVDDVASDPKQPLLPVRTALSAGVVSTALQCHPRCRQSIAVPVHQNGVVVGALLLQRSLISRLRAFSEAFAVDVAFVGGGLGVQDSAPDVATDRPKLYLATRPQRVTAVLAALGRAPDSYAQLPATVAYDETWYEVDIAPLPGTDTRLHILMVNDVTPQVTALHAVLSESVLIAVAGSLVSGLLLLALVWRPLRRLQALQAAAEALSQGAVARCCAQLPHTRAGAPPGDEFDGMSHALVAIAERISVGNREVGEAHAALRHLERDLQRMQAMAQVVRWQGEPLNGHFSFDAAVVEINPVLSHVTSWSEFIAFVHPQDRVEVLRAWRGGLPGSVFDTEFRLVINSDVLHVRATAMFEAVGELRVLRASGLMHNITALRSAERLLAEQGDWLEDKLLRRTRRLAKERDHARATADAKSLFAASVSHELRTPMNAVLGLAQIGMHESADRVATDRFAEIVRAGEHLLHVINDVLDLSKIESGSMTIEDSPFELQQVVTQTLEMVRPLAVEKGLQLSAEIVEPCAQTAVRGDATRVRQILINLLSNAIKFTARGKVDMRVYGDAGYCCFRVTDTGIGMSHSQLQQLFRPYRQVSRPADGHAAGTGLGLTISNRLAEAMGGEIRVRSRVDQGSEFELRLPMSPAGQTRMRYPLPVATADERGPTLLGLRVLVVDDVAINRSVTEHLLRLDGATAEVVVDGEEALQRLLDSGMPRVDVVLMDLQMPGTDGIEATRRLRAAGCNVPIIGVTADPSSAAYSAAMAAGMQDRLLKPLLRETLCESIDDLLKSDHRGGVREQAARYEIRVSDATAEALHYAAENTA